jgi:hypothetical protein
MRASARFGFGGLGVRGRFDWRCRLRLRRAVNRVDQEGGWRVLRDTGIDTTRRGVDARIAVQRVEHDADLGSITSQYLRDLQSFEVGHVGVNDEHVRSARVYDAQGVSTVLCHADNDQTELGIEQVAQVLAYRWMVIGDDHTERACGRDGHPSSIARFDRAEPAWRPTDQAARLAILGEDQP